MGIRWSEGREAGRYQLPTSCRGFYRTTGLLVARCSKPGDMFSGQQGPLGLLFLNAVLSLMPSMMKTALAMVGRIASPPEGAGVINATPMNDTTII